MNIDQISDRTLKRMVESGALTQRIPAQKEKNNTNLPESSDVTLDVTRYPFIWIKQIKSDKGLHIEKSNYVFPQFYCSGARQQMSVFKTA